MKIVEVFCGCGGFGALAGSLGHEVVLGIDNDSVALDSWHRNNPKGVKKCLTLPPKSPIQWPEGELHVHFSSPCQSFSGAKRDLTDSEKTLGDSLLRWSLDTAVEFKSWSFENVVSTHSKAILEEYKSNYPDKLDFTTAQCVDFGVPQQRTRLIAGPPIMIQRFKELTKTRHVTVEEALKAAHLPVNSDSVRSMAQLRTSSAPCLRKVTQPAYTVLTRPLRWHFESKRGKALTVPQMATLQSFPVGYKFPTNIQDGYRVIGNAVPPNLGLAILCAVTGAEFKPTLPPVIKYAAVEPESPKGTPAPALQAQLDHIGRELAEVKAMVAKLVS
jgi:site-specific DNA-cytosine methylase